MSFAGCDGEVRMRRAVSCRIFIAMEAQANLDKDYRLRARNIKAFATAQVLTHQHIIDAYHIVAGIPQLCPLLLVGAPREGLFLLALHPARFGIVSLARMGTAITRPF